ncbi:4547_t:CDS:2, partial [Racocetra persica]
VIISNSVKMSSLSTELEDPVSSSNNDDHDSNHNNDHVYDNNTKYKKCLKKEFSCANSEEYCKKRKKMQDEHGTIEGLFKKTSKDSSTTMLAEINNMKLRNMFTTWIINRQRLLAIIKDSEFVKIIQYLNSKA